MCGEAVSAKHRVDVESVKIFSNFAAQVAISDTQMTQKQLNALLMPSAFVFYQVPMPASRSMSEKPTYYCFLNPFMMLWTRRISKAATRLAEHLSQRISVLLAPDFCATAQRRSARTSTQGWVSVNGGGRLSFME